MTRALRQLQQYWFLLLLVVLITSGMFVGATLPSEQGAALSGLVNSQVITAVVLFLMSMSLDSRQLLRAFRSPAPVLWATCVCLGLVPLAGWGAMRLQGTPDFAIGLMISASLPCTLATCSVWTRRAGGNDAVSLLVTILTNGLCFLITPFWLRWATSESIELNAVEMGQSLFLVVIVPTALGQTARLIAAPERFATRHKTAIGVVAQLCILSLVFAASCKAGTRAASASGLGVSDVAVVWGSVIGLHVGALAVGWWGSRALGFARVDAIGVAFSCSQKTLPIGVYLATDPRMFGDPDLLGPGEGIPFAVFPILMFHASQLFIDTLVAARLSTRFEPAECEIAEAV